MACSGSGSRSPDTAATRARTSKALEPATSLGRFDLSAAGFTVTDRGDGGTTDYRVMPAGTAVTVSEAAAWRMKRAPAKGPGRDG
jgi:hypothetical protein